MDELGRKLGRRWFQFHLSTAIIMTPVAAGLIYANVVERFIGRSLIEHGWPITLSESWTGHPNEIFWPALVVDLAAGLAILFVVAFVCEFIARRRR